MKSISTTISLRTTKHLPCFLLIWLISGSLQSLLAQVVDYKTKIFIDDNGKKTTEKTILVQVNNKQENWLSHVEMRYDPNQKFSFNYANIIDATGNVVRKLKKKELITRNDLSHQAFYQDDLITEFDLYWNQYPYSVEYSYTIEEEEYLYIAWWTPLLYTHVPTITSSLEITLPSDNEVNINSSTNTIYKSSEKENMKILSWTTSLVQKPQSEIYSPPTETLIPTVKVIPANFKYGTAGSTSSWTSFGLWLDELNKGTDQLTLLEKQKVENLISGIDNKNEIVKKIYYYLQDHTKYVNVAIDVGGLKSYQASYVIKNKYGDCKALTTYMKAMLKSVGIESSYTVVKAGENEGEIDLDFPSQQFNHVILMIPSPTDTLWLENTSNALPFNYLGTFTQGRYTLAVNGERSQLIKTPELLPSDVLLERDFNFRLSGKNETAIEVELTLRGNEFEDYRYFISERDVKRQNDEVLEHTAIKGFKAIETSTLDFHRDSTFVRLNVTGTAPSIVRKIGPYKVINPLRIKLPDFEKSDRRELDVIINYPINRSDKSIYELQNFENTEIQIPEGINIESRYGKYRTIYSEEDNKLTVDEQFILFTNEISIDEYKDFHRFIESIISHKKNTAILIK